MIDLQKPYKLGVLFVHGIGEQAKGETLLRFGDPCISWLERWLQKNGEKLRVEDVQIAEEVPTDVSIGCMGKSEKILFRESWWAEKFLPPPIHELSWWLLLVGTWSTLSHSVKQIEYPESDDDNPLTRNDDTKSDQIPPKNLPKLTSNCIHILRAVFIYAPAALCYQIVIILLSILGTLPFMPLQNFFTNILLGMSRTLGDSYVLLHSPTQEKMAVDSVLQDVEKIASMCERTMIVAHSQGAAITYHALERAEFDITDIDFISVGSGLEKLEELRELNTRLEARESAKFSKRLYLGPALFVLFWIPIIIGNIFFNSFTYLTAVYWGGVLFILSTIFTMRNREPVSSICKPKCNYWLDIYASSDPVSNGPTTAEPPPDDDIQIINEMSLLRDHTTYFSNHIDFIPRIVSHMDSFGKITWINNGKDNGVKNKIEEWSIVKGVKSRYFRKSAANIAKWINLGIFLLYEFVAHGSLDKLKEGIALAFSWIGHLLFGNGDDKPDPFIGSYAEHWLVGVLAFITVDLVIRWCNRTMERTYTNLFFLSESVNGSNQSIQTTNNDSKNDNTENTRTFLDGLGKTLFIIMFLSIILVWLIAWLGF